ncbi:MAG: VOC family protein [Acidobacteriaceae bacterium]|jgi:predicted enzyme related to lactoylglutathione lyase|nr:VOC family protein [Acidobacteriaceae bacterium]
MKLLFAFISTLLVAVPASAQLSPFNAAGITYSHVHLNVTDIPLVTKIFVDHFGGVAVQKGTLQAVKLPNMLVAFRQAEPTDGSQGSVVDHFGFHVRDIAAVKDKWRAAGYKVTQEFTGAEGFPNAYLEGPGGLRIELQEKKDLPVIAAVNHVHFLTPDFEKLLDWYVETFSLTKRARGTIQTTADAGAVNLSFQTARTPTAPTRGRTIDHIGFEVRNLEAFCKQLEAKGIKFDTPYRDVPSIGLKIAYITDPSGAYIELTEGYDKY